MELRWRVKVMGKWRRFADRGLSKLDSFEAEEEEGETGSADLVGEMKVTGCQFGSFSRA
jgi:hypothetical protein